MDHKDQTNKKRRERRKCDEEHRKKLIKQQRASYYKHRDKRLTEKKNAYETNKNDKNWLKKQRHSQRLSMKKRIDYWKSLSNKYDNKCNKCGIQTALEWHHVDKTTKEFSIGRFQRRISIENECVFLTEIRKCIRLCRFCHRMETPQTNIRHQRFSIRRAAQYVNMCKREIKQCQHCKRGVLEGEEHGFDFDHINRNEKKAMVSLMVSRGFSNEKIDTETKKCQLLCANCHFIKTLNEKDHKPINFVV